MTGKDQGQNKSRLLDSIRGALSEHLDARIIYVSLSEHATDEDFDGRICSIKWVAWSLCNEKGMAITESHLDFVGPEHTKNEFERDLKEIFPDHQIHVDHDVSFDDE